MKPNELMYLQCNTWVATIEHGEDTDDGLFLKILHYVWKIPFFPNQVTFIVNHRYTMTGIKETSCLHTCTHTYNSFIIVFDIIANKN